MSSPTQTPPGRSGSDATPDPGPDEAELARPAPGRTSGEPAATLVIACGALAHELKAIVALDGLSGLEVECLPAHLHNRPVEIPDAVRGRIDRAVERAEHERILVAYADCGTGGRLAAVVEERRAAGVDVEMLAGAHCYEFFATSPRFTEIQDSEIGSFYLTDFLVKHFERMVWEGLGLDRHPELLPMYFGNYTRCVYLAQTDDPEIERAAHVAAERLGLDLLVERTGYGELRTTMVEIAGRP